MTGFSRIHGLWQSTIPSRFLDELPEAHVEVAEGSSSYGGYNNPYGSGSFAPGRGGGFSAGRQNPYGASRFDTVGAPSGGFASRGDQRAGEGRALEQQAGRTDQHGQQRAHRRAA